MMVHLGLPEAFVVVLLIFLVAITPSLSDCVQIETEIPGSWKYVLLWYLILLAILAVFWRALA